jgi:nitrilase
VSALRKVILGGHESIKIAVAQISPAWLDREASVGRACVAIAEAAKNHAQLIVFPEVWLAGYPYWDESWASDLHDWAAARTRFLGAAITVPGDEVERLSQAARAADAYVVMGCNELDARPGVQTVYNTLLFFAPDGTLIGRHRKLIPTHNERMFWGQGGAEDLFVLDTEIGRMGGLICGENLQPLLRAALMQQGEEIHIAVWPGPFDLKKGPRLQEPEEERPGGGDFIGHPLCRAYALEAGAFVVSAAGWLDPADVTAQFPYKNQMNIDWSSGGSSIIGPLGVPLAGPVYGQQLLYGECHAWMISAMKSIADTIGHYSRPDVLRLQLQREGIWGTVAPEAAPATPVAKPPRQS